MMLFVFVDEFWIALLGGPVVGCIFAFGAKAAARRPPEHHLTHDAEDRSELIAMLVAQQCHELQGSDDKASPDK